jgi:predicted nucleic acid-binding protein|nr:MAG: DNA-binding protein [Thermoproteus sp. AZ2]
MAIADTSFLVDWARYSKRDLLFRVFDVVWIPEAVLGEVRSEPTLTWISEGLASGSMSLMPELPEYREEAFRLMEASRRYKRLDYPEAYCIAVAAARGLIALSENGAAYMAQYTIVNARVWRAFEVLWELRRRGLIGSDEVYIYQDETRHKFPRVDLERWRTS